MLRYLLPLTLLFLLSCEAIIGGEGLVRNATTREALHEVRVDLIVKEDVYATTRTDEAGNFGLRELVGAVFGVPPFQLRFQKEGFRSVVMEGDSVYGRNYLYVDLLPAGDAP